MSTTVIQTRLSPALTNAIDARVKDAGTTRAEVVRELLEAALSTPQPVLPVPSTDPLLNRVADELGTVLAMIEATLEASRNGAQHAAAAHAAAKLGVLMLLPTDRQGTFVEKLAKVQA